MIDMKDLLKNSEEMKQALQKFILHDKKEIQLKTKELLDFLT